VSRKLRDEFIELLEEDVEFRYIVMGYLGISEVIKRLETIAREQVKLREDFKELRQEQIKLTREQIKLREDFKELRQEQIKLTQEQTKLREDFKKLREEQIKLREDFNKLREEQVRLREDFNKMLSVLVDMDKRLTRVERTLEKLTLDIEDEARIVVGYRLRDLGIRMKIDRLALPGIEINIYGVSNDLCIIGEATVRASSTLIDKLKRKIDKLKKNYPEKLRKRTILVICTSLALPDLVERARKERIWVLKATGDVVKPQIPR